MSVIKRIFALGAQFDCLDPFLFCAYHRDDFPPGNEKMEAPRRGNGMDFDNDQPYRMYHGDRIPGFPQHPHRGFETLTTTMVGFVDHTDSMGCAGRYGQGDLQWMTAGAGIVHGENFPLLYSDKPNPLSLFQLWLNLPKAKKMVAPAFVMHWGRNIPQFDADEGRVKVTVYAGELEGRVGLAPPPDSWATDPDNEVAVWLLKLQPGASYTIPRAKDGAVNRTLYFFEGDRARVLAQLAKPKTGMVLDASQDVAVHNPGQEEASFLLLQGRPIGEPVAQRGPFVMNTQAELARTYQDYQRTRFGGWPWAEDAVVFPRDKPRFAIYAAGQEEEYGPPPLGEEEGCAEDEELAEEAGAGAAAGDVDSAAKHKAKKKPIKKRVVKVVRAQK